MTIETFFYFILGLGLLIFIHELGHFLVAKRCGIRVEKFSLGFGPALIAFIKEETQYRITLFRFVLGIKHSSSTKGETEYRISLLPFGGYVKMSGEEPAEEAIQPVHDPRSFSAQPLRKRALVVAAGPIMNLVLAFVLMPLVFMMGRLEPVFMEQAPIVLGVKKDSPAQKAGLEKGDRILSIDGTQTGTWELALQRILLNPDREVSLRILRKSTAAEETKKIQLGQQKEGKAGYLGVEPNFFIGNEPIVDQVSPESPAQKAGLKPKDKILSIGGEKVEDWQEMSEKVAQSNGKPVPVEILRGSEKITLTVTPLHSEEHNKWILGITKEARQGDFVKRRYGFLESVKRGAQENIRLLGLTLEVLKKLVTGQLSYKSLGGPVQIAQATAQAAQSGIGDFVYFLSFLSIQLGVLNLLPIPVLDGGHLLFMGYEAIRRRPLSIRKRMIATQVGMVLLLTLMILVTFNDVKQIEGVRNFFGKMMGWF